ncbi:hypothetical protein V1289_007378 [Bradyrhizobium sp. AZCC 2289]
MPKIPSVQTAAALRRQCRSNQSPPIISAKREYSRLGSETLPDFLLECGKPRLRRQIQMREKPGFPAHSRVSRGAWPNAGMRGWRRSADRTRLHANSLLTGNFTGKFAIWRPRNRFRVKKPLCCSDFSHNSLRKLTGKKIWITGTENPRTGNFRASAKSPKALMPYCKIVSIHFSHTCFVRFGRDLFSPTIFQVEDEMSPVREPLRRGFLAGKTMAWL